MRSIFVETLKHMKVVSARITKMPDELFDPMPQVYVTMEDGKEQFLFDYYPDEISFTPNEFVGLTIEECRHLKFQKDRRFLTT
jgi:hypothetical protein